MSDTDDPDYDDSSSVPAQSSNATYSRTSNLVRNFNPICTLNGWRRVKTTPPPPTLTFEPKVLQS